SPPSAKTSCTSPGPGVVSHKRRTKSKSYCERERAVSSQSREHREYREHQIRALLREKKLDRTLAGAGLLSREEQEERLLASGWASVDRAVGGGFPRGECSEIVGSPSSGRTALLMTLLAEATRRGEIVALVDALDRFDPRAAVEM